MNSDIDTLDAASTPLPPTSSFSISDFLWNESFWLPSEHSWDSLDFPPGLQYPDASWLLGSPFRWSLSLLIIRFLIQTLIFDPIGKRLGITEVFYVSPEKNSILENFLNSGQSPRYRNPPHQQLEQLAHQTGTTPAYVKNWFFLQRKHAQTSDMRKWSMACWKCLSYSSLFVLGLYTLWPKDWFWTLNSTRQNSTITDYPLNQYIEDDVYFFIALQFVFNLNLLWSLPLDTDRKSSEFLPLLLYHVATVALDFIGVTMRLHRFVVVGHLLLAPCGALLEFARATHYVGKHNNSKGSHRAAHWLSNVSFILFACTWIVTRTVLYPLLIGYPVVVSIPTYTGWFPALYVVIALAATIFVLELYWTTRTCRVTLRALGAGKSLEVAASDAEDELFEGEGSLHQHGVTNAAARNGLHGGSEPQKRRSHGRTHQNGELKND